MAHPDNRFVMFGCWNQDSCSKDQVPRDRVIQTIRKNIQLLNPGRIIVAGDNVYPLEDVHGGKIYRKITIDNGFSQLASIPNTKIDILLGNHDINYNRCFLNYEKLYGLNVYDEHSSLDSGNIHFIYLDTNQSVGILLEYLKANMSKIHLNIVVGHHPIYSTKGKKLNSMVGYDNFLRDLLPWIYREQIHWIYLCADTHHFQANNINFENYTFPQLIVGTGGGDLDPIPKIAQHAQQDSPQIDIIKAVESHGFLYGEITPDGPLILTFCQVPECNVYSFRLNPENKLEPIQFDRLALDCINIYVDPNYREKMASDCFNVAQKLNQPYQFDDGDFTHSETGDFCARYKFKGQVPIRLVTRILTDPSVKIDVPELEAWDQYIETVIKGLIDDGSQIKGLQCVKDPSNIARNTFRDSKFDVFSKYMKALYDTLLKEDYITILEQFKGLDSILTNFQSPSDEVYLYPRYMFFDGRWFQKVFSKVPAQQRLEAEIGFCKGAMDEQIYKTKLFQQHESLFYPYYQQIFSDILQKLETHRIVVSLSFSIQLLGSNNTYHSIVTIFTKNKTDNLVCMVYDPNYYVRDGKDGRKQSSYIWAVNSVYFYLKRYDPSCEFINLSEFCYRSNSINIHCIQYMIDAEYCLFYSLYFIYLYLLKGSLLDTKSLKSIISETYISDPGYKRINSCIKLKRATVKMMSFILTIFVKLIHDQTLLEIIKDYLDDIQIPLLSPGIRGIIDKKIRDDSSK